MDSDTTPVSSSSTATVAPGRDALVESARAARLALNRRQQAFVELYARPGSVNGEPCLNAAEAARRAGYSPKRADSTAQNLMKIPKVRAAVDAIRAEVAALSSYDVVTAMAELATAMEGAKKTDQWSAYTRAAELRARIAGVLVDRIDARVAVGTFSINVEGLNGA